MLEKTYSTSRKMREVIIHTAEPVSKREVMQEWRTLLTVPMKSQTLNMYLLTQPRRMATRDLK